MLRLDERKERLIELVLVLSVTVISPIIISLYACFSGQQIYNRTNQEITYLNGILARIIGIGILFYVLYRQNRSIREIGYSFSLKDLIRSIGLVIIAYISSLILGIFLVLFFPHTSIQPNNIDFLKGKITILYFLMIVINPWFEELILRAYVISEVKWLTNNIVLAVIASVLIQTLGHLYQGLLPAVSLSVLFLVFSLYYIKTSRITPVIFAHLFFDIISMVYYSTK